MERERERERCEGRTFDVEAGVVSVDGLGEG